MNAKKLSLMAKNWPKKGESTITFGSNSNSLLKMELKDVQKVHTFHTLDEIFINQVALSHSHFPLFFMILLVLFKRHHYVTLRFFAHPTNFGIEHSALLNE